MIVVRPDDVNEDDDTWATAVERWRNESRATTGNRVDVLELSHDELRTRLASDKALWRDVVRTGIPVYGLTIEELLEPAHA